MRPVALVPAPSPEVDERLGLAWRDRDLLALALTHRSYAFENGGLDTNERLEFLGDAVLALVITEVIYHAHPAAPEGELAKLRAAAVRTSALAAVARDLGLGPHVRLGKGEAASGGADKDSILADTLEAVIGACYIDGGFPAATELVHRLFGARLEAMAADGAALDYKTSLQELTAARFNTLPTYVLAEEGPDHRKSFTATVKVAGDTYGSGHGRNKKEAEQAAAREAYLSLTSAAGSGLTTGSARARTA